MFLKNFWHDLAFWQKPACFSRFFLDQTNTLLNKWPRKIKVQLFCTLIKPFSQDLTWHRNNPLINVLLLSPARSSLANEKVSCCRFFHPFTSTFLLVIKSANAPTHLQFFSDQKEISGGRGGRFSLIKLFAAVDSQSIFCQWRFVFECLRCDWKMNYKAGGTLCAVRPCSVARRTQQADRNENKVVNPSSDETLSTLDLAPQSQHRN